MSTLVLIPILHVPSSPCHYMDAQDMSEHICARPCPVRSFTLPLLISCERAGREQAHLCSFLSCAFLSCTFLLPLSSLHERAHLCPPLSCVLLYPSPLDLTRTPRTRASTVVLALVLSVSTFNIICMSET